MGLGISQILFGIFIFFLATEHCIGEFKLEIQVKQCTNISRMEWLITFDLCYFKILVLIVRPMVMKLI